MKALLLLALLAVPAAADPGSKDQAKAHFKQGKAFQDVGAYDKAADEYKAAYEIDPRPEMLFNIAQAYRLAGTKQAALDYFQKYLDAQPNGAGADEARQHVAELTKEIEEDKKLHDKLPATVITPDVPPVVEKSPPPAPPAPPPTVERVHSPTMRIVGLASAGVGVLGVGFGVKLGLDARNDADAISKKQGTSWTAADRATFEDGQAANRNMYIAYGVGAALIIGGATLYVVGSQTEVVPLVTPQGAGVGVQGAF
jgi:tetratricopeptide (TPR) repeat protein